MEKFIKDTEEALVKQIIEMVGDDYNNYPELVSLLCNVNLLPEQIKEGKDALYMAAIVEAYNRGLKHHKPFHFGV